MRVSANKSPFVKGGFRGNVNTDSRKKESRNSPFFCESAGARTRDPNIKSVVLYLLSYGFSAYQRLSVWWCKDSQYFYFTKICDYYSLIMGLLSPIYILSDISATVAPT